MAVFTSLDTSTLIGLSTHFRIVANAAMAMVDVASKTTEGLQYVELNSPKSGTLSKASWN